VSPAKEEIAFEQDLEQVRGLLRHNDVEGAERLCRNLISRHPGRTQAHEQLGRILLRAERFGDALTELKTAVQIDPAFAPAWKSMAIVGLTGGDSTVAEMAARRLCALRANDPWSWFMLGHALSTMSRFEEAETVFERARRSPGAVEARISLVQDAIARKNLQGAIKHGERATHWAPGDANAWAALGHAFTCAGQHQNAVEALRKACQIAPCDAESLKRLATALGMLRRADDELVDIRQRLLALEPDSIEAREKLGLALIGARRGAEAVVTMRELHAKAPDNLLSRWIELHLPEQPGFRSLEDRAAWMDNWQRGLSEFEALDPRTPNLGEQARKILGSIHNFSLAYLGGADVDLHRRHARVVRTLLQSATDGSVTDAPQRPIGTGRRRVGIISSCLHRHSVSRAWSGALLALPREDFELHVFYTDVVDDDQVQRFRDRAENFQGGATSFSVWSQRLHEARLDIAIFLDLGMDVINQCLAAVRHAPVQIATWAHPVTTGAETIDYFLSADAAEPGDARDHYSEVLHRLPRLGGCFALPQSVALDPPPAGAGAHLMCVQSLFKLQPEHDALFARMAAGAPAARFSFLTAATARQTAVFEQRLHAELQRHAVDPSRFRVLPTLSVEQYSYELTSADLLLDTVGFSGSMTTLDSLWQERPVLTLPGKLMRGRQSYAMLSQLELDDLIASDPDDYVHRAAALAQNRDQRDAIRKQIRERKHQLFEDREVSMALADFLRAVEPSGTTPTSRPQYPPIDEARAKLQFQNAVAQGRAGHWQDSGRGFAAAWRSAPDQPRSAQGMLECALHLARSGIAAPAIDLRWAPRAAGRISIIVCSIDPRRLARLKVDLDRLLPLEDWELIHVPDARSLCEGYTRGLSRASGELIVFCHDDIGIACEDFADRLRRHLAQYDLIGVAGADYVNGPAWHWAGPPHTASWVSLPRPDGALVCGLLGAHGALLRNAQVLDGVFLAGRRAVFEQIPFDADTFDGFHCYDLDLSYRAYRAGLRCAVTLDLLIWHQSGGNFGESWRQYVDRLIAKFPELTPRGPAAPYRTGAIVVESALVPPVYGWIAHWLSAPPPTID